MLKVQFGHRSDRTRIIKQTLCAKWDEVVLLDSIVLPGNMSQAIETVPRILCEAFDYDSFGGDDFLGRFTADVKIRTKVAECVSVWSAHSLSSTPRPLHLCDGMISFVVGSREARFLQALSLFPQTSVQHSQCPNLQRQLKNAPKSEGYVYVGDIR